MDKLTSIKNWISNNNHGFFDIPDESIDNIYNLLINGILNEPNHDIEMLYYGVYYKKQKDYDNMKKYYLMAIENGYSTAMYNLGYYYKNQKDYDNMLKYYLMAIEKGNSSSMNNLGYYYSKQKDYDNMIKYYLMAIEKGNSNAMYNLGKYYWEQKNYDNMLKYYLMASEKGNSDAMYNLGYYYFKQKDYDNMLKYYLMAINSCNLNAKNITLTNLREIITNDILNTKHYIQLIEQLNYKTYSKIVENNKIAILLYNTYKSKIDLLELPFKYSPDNDGFNEAKNDFIQQIQKIEN